jgi:hypothetical protein
MRNLLFTAGGALALVAGATSANAAITVFSPNPANFTPPQTGGFLGTVAPSAGATSSTLTPFNDVFNFNIVGVPGTFDSHVSTVQLQSSQDIDFSSVFLTLDGSSTILGNYFMISGDPNTEAWQCCGATLATLAPLTLNPGNYSIHLVGNLTGNLSGSYSGTINTQTVAVPEPATWAMMLLGFFGVGMALRRRQAVASSHLGAVARALKTRPAVA